MNESYTTVDELSTIMFTAEEKDLYRLDYPYVFHGTASTHLHQMVSTGFLFQPYVTPSPRMARCFALATTHYVGGEPVILRMPKKELHLRVDDSLVDLLDPWMCSEAGYALTDLYVLGGCDSPEEAWGLAGDAFFRADGRDPSVARAAIEGLVRAEAIPTPEDSLRLLGSALASHDVPVDIVEVSITPDAAAWSPLRQIVTLFGVDGIESLWADVVEGLA
jgi:hypothetical protein